MRGPSLIKVKTDLSVKKAFETFFVEIIRQPENLAKNFIRNSKSFLGSTTFKKYHTFNEVKVVVIERF